ncbi:TetR family transcriptional regulator [Agromyces mediolanus]|uniref:TetR/AcrR family transcriptional regulator n=1 Tax=Agromyces mediolanus TaxID=41986 RepID=UPI00203D330B|nr:TetR family transcriptional regulator [Agromyces mediolanus]MCM3658656.1 TetR family transcriptional regulator [Agromyces mediolanus]
MAERAGRGYTRRVREDRRDELLVAAVKLAREGGLTSITARRLAAEVGVAQGLVTHYFGTVDELLAAAFAFAADAERRELAERVAGDGPLEQLRGLLAAYGAHERDPAALLWLDAWRESARRPAVRDAVVRQMEQDLAELDELVGVGVAAGVFPAAGPHSAMRILALVDGLAANAAVRTGLADSPLDYADVFDFVLRTAETELGLEPGLLDA